MAWSDRVYWYRACIVKLGLAYLYKTAISYYSYITLPLVAKSKTYSLILCYLVYISNFNCGNLFSTLIFLFIHSSKQRFWLISVPHPSLN